MGYKFLYSGGDGKRNGVGVVLDKELKKCVTDVKRINDRIIVVKMVWKKLILNIISVYAPQVGCDDLVKGKFWEDFDSILMNIPQSENVVYLGGDFNGHVGRMKGEGAWGVGLREAESRTLLQVASAFDLVIVNTFFKKRDEYLITYQSGNHRTQIDYFLLRRTDTHAVVDCKVIPGEL